MIRGVPSEAFLDALPDLADFFRQFEALDADPAITLVRDILAKGRQCYVAEDEGKPIACILTSVHYGKNVMIEYAAGSEHKKWAAEMLAIAEGHAAHLGGKVIICGRKGWIRALGLKGRGYREKYIVMEQANG